jgi:hypothetical protein
MMSAEDASNAKQKLGGAIIDGRKIEVRSRDFLMSTDHILITELPLLISVRTLNLCVIQIYSLSQTESDTPARQ